MYSINEVAKTVVEQGQNVLACAKDMKQIANKKGKERSNLYERYCANKHSFNVYTYMNTTIENLSEIQVFQRKTSLFRIVFEGTRIDYKAEVDVQQVEIAYEELVAALREMTRALSLLDNANKN